MVLFARMYTYKARRHERYVYGGVTKKMTHAGAHAIFLVFFLSVLGSDAVDVAGEHGAFLDIGDAEEASRDTLKADGEAAVRGHAVAEGVEVEMESIRVHATTEHLLAVVSFLMDTLSAGGDLQTTHKQVETERQRWVLRIVHRIESTMLGREMGDEHKVRTVFLEGVLTDSALFFRSQVIFTAVVLLAQVILEENLMHFAQFPSGNLLGQYGVHRIEELQLVRTIAFNDSDDMTKQGSLEGHDVLLTFDEAHLDIEGDVLIEVTGGSMFLCAVSGSDLEDALIDADADLFVELRALRKVYLLTEIIHLEDVSAAFSSFGDDLRGEDLGEAVGAQELAEGTCDGRLHLEDRHITRVAEGDLTVVELITQKRLFVAELQGVHVHYLGGCRTAQDADLGDSDLNSVVESCGVFDLCLVDRTGEGDRHLAAEVVHRDLCARLVEELGGVIADYRLQQTTRFAENDEAAPLSDADVMDHTVNGNRFANLAVGEICHVFVMFGYI